MSCAGHCTAPHRMARRSRRTYLQRNPHARAPAARQPAGRRSVGRRCDRAPAGGAGERPGRARRWTYRCTLPTGKVTSAIGTLICWRPRATCPTAAWAIRARSSCPTRSASLSALRRRGSRSRRFDECGPTGRPASCGGAAAGTGRSPFAGDTVRGRAGPGASGKARLEGCGPRSCRLIRQSCRSRCTISAERSIRPAYAWQYGQPGGETVFDFQLGRGREGPRKFLASSAGVLQTDGYQACEEIGGPKLVRVGCWARARRKFVDHVKVNGDDAAAVRMVLRMDRLSLVDRDAQQKQMTAEEGTFTRLTRPPPAPPRGPRSRPASRRASAPAAPPPPGVPASRRDFSPRADRSRDRRTPPPACAAA